MFRLQFYLSENPPKWRFALDANAFNQNACARTLYKYKPSASDSHVTC